MSTRESISGGGERFLLDLATAARERGDDVALRVARRSWLAEQWTGRRLTIVRPVIGRALVLNDFRSVWSSIVRDRFCARHFIVHGAWQLSPVRAGILRLWRVRVWVVSSELKAKAASLGLDAEVVDLWPVFRGAGTSRRRLSTCEPRVLNVARLDPIKRLELFAELTAHLGWPATLVCDKPQTANEREMLDRVRIANSGLRIVHGTPVEEYGGADLFISTSASESFGIALTEALSHEIPVLTTALGGPVELLRGPLSLGLLSHTDGHSIEELASVVVDAWKRVNTAPNDYWTAVRQLLNSRGPEFTLSRVVPE